MRPEIKYPEHEKLSAVKNESQAIGAFLEWMFMERGWHLAYYDERLSDTLQPVDGGHDIQKILAEYFQIDLDKISDEKDQMLAEIRAVNEERT